MRLHVFPSTFSLQTYMYNVTSNNMMHTIAFMFYITYNISFVMQVQWKVFKWKV